MKIFINAESLSDQPTGVGLYLENILNIFSSKYSNKNQFILFAKRDSKKLRFFQKNGFKVKILNFNFLNKYIHSIVYYFWISILLYRDKYDVIWFSNPRSAFFFPKSSVVFTTIHDFTYLFQPFTQRLFGFILDRFFTPFCIKKSNKLIFTSNSVANEYLNIYPKNQKEIIVAKLGVNKSYLKSRNLISDEKKDIVLFIGTLEPRKNIEKILRAYAGLESDLKEKYKLYLIGKKGWGNINIKKIIHDNNLASYVIFKNYVSENEKRYYLKRAKCLIYPSLYEGFGLPILESQSFGIPVITSNIGAMKEVSGKGAILVDPYSVKSIKSAMEKLLLNEFLHKKISYLALENVKDYDWNKTAEIIFTSFKERK